MAAAPQTSSARLFSKQTQALMFNFKPEPVQRMLDFDYMCGKDIKDASLAGLITPGSSRGNHKVFYGTAEKLIPVYGTVVEACQAHPNADVFINFASFRSAFQSSMEALEQPTIRTVAIIAEGIPERETKRLIAYARAHNKVIIGPATVGGIQAGAFKIADTAGTPDNIISSKLYRPGSVGFVSKSGGLSNEMYNILAKNTDGLYEGIAIGGDSNAGSTFLDHIMRFQDIPEIKMIVMLGELGGDNEYGIVKALKEKKITKPVLAWVSGTCASMFPSEVQFGHAGAKSGGAEKESAQAKNAALREAGAVVPNSFEDFPRVISEVYHKLLTTNVVIPLPEPPVPTVPANFGVAVKDGRVRRATGIISTICDDRGDEPTYARTPMSELIEKEATIGDVIGLLWFKRSLPKYGARFIEIVLMLCADHGPCVSGAHNAIVASRAGKDIVSCVASGLLTIGPRFGGAIDDAARYWKKGHDQKMDAPAFLKWMREQGQPIIPGIGHRIKSADNMDKRVVLLKEYAAKNFPSHTYLNFALAVEKETLKKGANLVLNVDGCIAALFLDLMRSCASFSDAEMNEIVDTGYLNGFFVVARSIGLIGHALDQKRLKQPLYRHPWDDVMYLDE